MFRSAIVTVIALTSISLSGTSAKSELKGGGGRINGVAVNEAALRSFVAREYFSFNFFPVRLSKDGTYTASNYTYVENGIWRIQGNDLCLVEQTEGRPTSENCWNVTISGSDYQLALKNRAGMFDVSFKTPDEFRSEMDEEELRISNIPEEEAYDLYMIYLVSGICSDTFGTYSENEVVVLQKSLAADLPKVTSDIKEKAWDRAKQNATFLSGLPESRISRLCDDFSAKIRPRIQVSSQPKLAPF